MNRSFLESVNIGVICLDDDGKLLSLNPAAEKMLGIKENEVNSLLELIQSLKIFNSDNSSVNVGELNALLSGINKEVNEDIILKKYNKPEAEFELFKCRKIINTDSQASDDPKIFVTLERLTNIASTDSSVNKTGSNFEKNVTGVSKREEELAANIEKLETALGKIRLGVWEFDVINDSTYWSDEMYRLFYRDPKDGAPGYAEFLFLIHPDDRNETDEYFQNSLINGKPNDIVFRTNPDNGPVIYISTQYSCITKNNQVLKIFGTNIDITSKIRAEREQKVKVSQLVKAAEIAKIGYWEYDVASDMFTFNDGFYSIFGTTVDEVGGYKLSSSRYAELFVHPEDVMLVGNEIRKALQTKDADYKRRLKHRMIYSDGSIGMIEVQFHIIKDEAGKTIKTFGINQDITGREKI